jgi:hypothetical protein
MYCAHCGQQLEEGAHFCRKCGQPIGQPPQQPPAYQQPTQQPSYQQPSTPAYQQPQPPAYQQPSYGSYKHATGANFKLPANWKIYLPVLGTLLAFFGFILPWVSGYGISYSGFTMASLAGQYSYGFTKAILFVVAFWIAFICCFVGLVIFWKNPKSRLIASIGGGVGLLMMILIAITLGDMGGSGVGFGYVLCWIGFVVIFGGTIFAWRDLTVSPMAPPPY